MIQQSQEVSVTDGRVDKLAHVCLHSEAFCDSLLEGLLPMNSDLLAGRTALQREQVLCA